MKLIKIISAFLALTCILSLTGCSRYVERDLTKIDYSENIDSIIHYFPELGSVEHVYFKSQQVGHVGGIGPSTFCIVGFVCLSKTDADTIRVSYEFTAATPSFPDGISPQVTNAGEFSWCKNAAFTHSLLAGKYAGAVYFDLNNGIVYLDVVNA